MLAYASIIRFISISVYKGLVLRLIWLQRLCRRSNGWEICCEAGAPPPPPPARSLLGGTDGRRGVISWPSKKWCSVKAFVMRKRKLCDLCDCCYGWIGIPCFVLYMFGICFISVVFSCWWLAIAGGWCDLLFSSASHEFDLFEAHEFQWKRTLCTVFCGALFSVYLSFTSWRHAHTHPSCCFAVVSGLWIDRFHIFPPLFVKLSAIGHQRF